MACPIEIRTFRPGDEEAVLALHNHVFANGAAGIPPRSMEHWRWKYLQNPTGLLQVSVAEHEQEGLVGAYPVMPLRYVLDGDEAVAAQAVDLVVLPRFRRAGPRPGLFVALGRHNRETWGGAGRTEFHYGWPVEAWSIGKRYLGYEMIRDWNFLVREGHGGFPRRDVPSGLRVVKVPRYAGDVDVLWDELAPGLRCAAVRDAAYFNWRYATHPEHEHCMFECREGDTGRVRAVMVFKVTDFLRPRTALIVDWLGRKDDVDATVSLIAAAEAAASRGGLGVLATLFNPIDSRCLMFQRLGFLVHGTSYFLGMSAFDRRGAVFYRDHWYLTPGDSDLV